MTTRAGEGVVVVAFFFEEFLFFDSPKLENFVFFRIPQTNVPRTRASFCALAVSFFAIATIWTSFRFCKLTAGMAMRSRGFCFSRRNMDRLANLSPCAAKSVMEIGLFTREHQLACPVVSIKIGLFARDHHTNWPGRSRSSHKLARSLAIIIIR